MAEVEKKEEQGATKTEGTPSMEEILQSIRGVISGEEGAGDDVLELTELAEDGTKQVMAAEQNPVEEVKPTSEAAAPPIAEKSILDDIDAALGNSVDQSNAAQQDEPVMVEPKPAPEETIPEPVIEEPVVEVAPSVIPEPSVVDNVEENPVAKEPVAQKTNPTKLLDEKVIQESSGSLKELVNSVHEKHVDSPYTRNGTSLEALVIEAMKPFLADWLNKNLPIIVKKIVEKEVKRLIPKEEDE